MLPRTIVPCICFAFLGMFSSILLQSAYQVILKVRMWRKLETRYAGAQDPTVLNFVFGRANMHDRQHQGSLYPNKVDRAERVALSRRSAVSLRTTSTSA